MRVFILGLEGISVFIFEFRGGYLGIYPFIFFYVELCDGVDSRAKNFYRPHSRVISLETPKSSSHDKVGECTSRISSRNVAPC